MALITEVELKSLLPKMGRKVLYPIPIFIKYVKQVPERVTSYN